MKLFVCMGNICRSPIVAAVARVEFARAGIAVEVDSAGTEDYHVGASADRRSIAIAEANGYPLASHRARQVCAADFSRFDHLLVMDRINHRASLLDIALSSAACEAGCAVPAFRSESTWVGRASRPLLRRAGGFQRARIWPVMDRGVDRAFVWP